MTGHRHTVRRQIVATQGIYGSQGEVVDAVEGGKASLHRSGPAIDYYVAAHTSNDNTSTGGTITCRRGASELSLCPCLYTYVMSDLCVYSRELTKVSQCYSESTHVVGEVVLNVVLNRDSNTLSAQLDRSAPSVASGCVREVRKRGIRASRSRTGQRGPMSKTARAREADHLQPSARKAVCGRDSKGPADVGKGFGSRRERLPGCTAEVEGTTTRRWRLQAQRRRVGKGREGR
ncbi:hypothetical protein GGR52DRAFT_546404 [Hypoxylon sp. FL1284]|nr:hypothetical protein GGR52DRAFT_546404 [Hypoxylon sp. FL1284]